MVARLKSKGFMSISKYHIALPESFFYGKVDKTYIWIDNRSERQMKNTYAPVHCAAKLLGRSIPQGREGTVGRTQMLEA